MKIHPKLWLFALASAPIAQPAQATVTDAWLCGSNNWSTSGCWFSSAFYTQPHTGDNVNLTQSDTSNRTVTVDSSISLSTLTIDATGSGTMTLSQNGYGLTTGSEYIGYTGGANYNQSGGTNAIGSLYLGYNTYSTGTYNLSGTGSLTASNEYVAYNGIGIAPENSVFNQTGGTNTISGSLDLGYNLNGIGTYNLGGTGSLSAFTEVIGYLGLEPLIRVAAPIRKLILISATDQAQVATIKQAVATRLVILILALSATALAYTR